MIDTPPCPHGQADWRDCDVCREEIRAFKAGDPENPHCPHGHTHWRDCDVCRSRVSLSTGVRMGRPAPALRKWRSWGFYSWGDVWIIVGPLAFLGWLWWMLPGLPWLIGFLVALGIVFWLTRACVDWLEAKLGDGWVFNLAILMLLVGGFFLFTLDLKPLLLECPGCMPRLALMRILGREGAEGLVGLIVGTVFYAPTVIFFAVFWGPTNGYRRFLTESKESRAFRAANIRVMKRRGFLPESVNPAGMKQDDFDAMFRGPNALPVPTIAESLEIDREAQELVRKEAREARSWLPQWWQTRRSPQPAALPVKEGDKISADVVPKQSTPAISASEAVWIAVLAVLFLGFSGMALYNKLHTESPPQPQAQSIEPHWTVRQAQDHEKNWQPGKGEIEPTTSTGRPPSNFVTFKLPRGVELEMPKGWRLLGSEHQQVIATAVEAASDLSGIPLTENKSTLIAANSMPATTYAAIRINSVAPASMTPAVLTQATPAFVAEIGREFEAIMHKSLGVQGLQLLEFLGVRVDKLSGHPALVFEYRRSGPNGPVLVQLTRVVTKQQEVEINLSYREHEVAIWKPVIAKVRQSIVLKPWDGR